MVNSTQWHTLQSDYVKIMERIDRNCRRGNNKNQTDIKRQETLIVLLYSK